MKALFPKFKKATYRTYAKLLRYTDCLKESSYHNDVVSEIEDLIDEKKYLRKKAIKVALGKNKAHLKDMLKEKFETMFGFGEDDEVTDSSDEEDSDD